MFNQEQSMVYYHKTDLLYNLVGEKDGKLELHLNCPHIKKEQIIFVDKEDIDMVEDVTDPFNPEDYGFIADKGNGKWIEDWSMEVDNTITNVYYNGSLHFHIFVERFRNLGDNLSDHHTLYHGRIPSKTEGDIIMKNLGFKRKK